MGMINTLTMKCPYCDRGHIAFQAKAGEERERVYSMEYAPDALRESIEGDVVICPACERGVDAPPAPGRLDVTQTLHRIKLDADKPSLVRVFAQDALRAHTASSGQEG